MNRGNGEHDGEMGRAVETVEASADRILREAMLASAQGLDLDAVERVIGWGVQALEKQMTALAGAVYAPEDYSKVAKAGANVVKALDEILRLAQFAKGAPDSRPGGGAGREWLQALTDTQLEVVEGWIREAEGR